MCKGQGPVLRCSLRRRRSVVLSPPRPILLFRHSVRARSPFFLLSSSRDPPSSLAKKSAALLIETTGRWRARKKQTAAERRCAREKAKCKLAFAHTRAQRINIFIIDSDRGGGARAHKKATEPGARGRTRKRPSRGRGGAQENERAGGAGAHKKANEPGAHKKANEPGARGFRV